MFYTNEHFKPTSNDKNLKTVKTNPSYLLYNQYYFQTMASIRIEKARVNNDVIVDLDRLNLKELSHDLFENTPQLTGVYLENNQLTSIPENLFANTPQLSVVYLNYNQLTSIPENLFANTPHIVTGKQIGRAHV